MMHALVCIAVCQNAPVRLSQQKIPLNKILTSLELFWVALKTVLGLYLTSVGTVTL